MGAGWGGEPTKVAHDMGTYSLLLLISNNLFKLKNRLVQLWQELEYGRVTSEDCQYQYQKKLQIGLRLK